MKAHNRKPKLPLLKKTALKCQYLNNQQIQFWNDNFSFHACTESLRKLWSAKNYTQLNLFRHHHVCMYIIINNFMTILPVSLKNIGKPLKGCGC